MSARLFVGLALVAASMLAIPAARAGSIFDDDYVPPPITRPALELPAGPDQQLPAASRPSAEPTTPQTVDSVEAPAQRLPVPRAASQSPSRALFKEAYAADLRDRTPAARLSLARKLVVDADKASANPTERFVLLFGACEAAAEGGDLQLVVRAAGSAAAAYTVDSMRISADVLLKSPPKTTIVPAGALDAGILIEDAVARSVDFTAASKLLAELETWTAGDLSAGRRLRDATRQLGEMRATRDKSVAALERLKTRPDDATANGTVGRFLCFVLEDYAHGLAYLAKCDAPAVASAAKRDLGTGTADAEAAVDTGNGWWDLSGDRGESDMARTGMRRRARFWYRVSLAADASGLKRTVMEQRIAEGTPQPRGADALSAASSAAGTIHLTPNHAKLQGNLVIGGLSPTQLAAWGLSGVASWTFPGNGTFTVVLAYGAAGEAEGGTYALAIDREQIPERVTSTGDWSVKNLVDLGTVRLTPGAHTLSIRALTKPGGGLMNVFEVVLIPAK